MVLDKKEHKAIILQALSGIQVNWNLANAKDAVKKQTEVLELVEALDKAEVKAPKNAKTGPVAAT